MIKINHLILETVLFLLLFVFPLNILCEMQTHECKILKNLVKNPMTSHRNMIAIVGCKITDLWVWRNGSVIRALCLLPQVLSSIPNTHMADHNYSPMESNAFFWCVDIHTIHMKHICKLKKNTGFYFLLVFSMNSPHWEQKSPEDRVRRCVASFFFPQQYKLVSDLPPPPTTHTPLTELSCVF